MASDCAVHVQAETAAASAAIADRRGGGSQTDRGALFALPRRQRTDADQPGRRGRRRHRDRCRRRPVSSPMPRPAFKAARGAFDITSGLLRQAWDFSKARLPEQREIDALLPRIGLDKVTPVGRPSRIRASRHGARPRRARQGIRGRSRRGSLQRDGGAARLRRSRRRHPRDRPAARRPAVADRHSRSPRRRKRWWPRSRWTAARWRPAATTSASSRWTASAIVTSSIPGPDGRRGDCRR